LHELFYSDFSCFPESAHLVGRPATRDDKHPVTVETAAGNFFGTYYMERDAEMTQCFQANKTPHQ
jgi:hypothetical protein